MSEIDFDILSDYSNEEDFINELEAAAQYIQAQQCKSFFKIVLSHFQARVPENIGNAILNTIRILLSNQQFLNKFAAGAFINDLPFRQKNLTDKLLDVLYILIKKAPYAFDQQAAELFSRLIPRNPSKTLVLLTMYGEMMNDVTDPWSMIDNLFNGERYFLEEEYCEEYVRVLGYLYENFPIFRSRGEESLKVINKALQITNDFQTIEGCYKSMCLIVSHEVNVILPINRIREDIKKEEHSKSAIRVLLSAPIESIAIAEANNSTVNKNSKTDGRLARTLIRAAQDSEEAALVVMRLCESEIFATSLTEFTAWMEAELPTVDNTLQIFLCIFQHKRLRRKLSNAAEFGTLLQMAIEEGDLIHLEFAITVLRRIYLGAELIADLEDIFKAFIESALAEGSPEAIYSILLLGKTLIESENCSGSGCMKILRRICGTIIEECRNHSENFGASVGLSKDLCRYPKCLSYLQEKGLRHILKSDRSSNKPQVREVIDLLR